MPLLIKEYWKLLPLMLFGMAFMLYQLEFSSNLQEMEALDEGPAPKTLDHSQYRSFAAVDLHQHQHAEPHPETDLDISENEFRLKNLERLMATRLSSVTQLEKQLIVEQILSELPYLVRVGELHPYDATLAHVYVAKHQNSEMEEHDVAKIEEEYVGLYPSNIRVQGHPDH